MLTLLTKAGEVLVAVVCIGVRLQFGGARRH
jgi:hypothetical protein